MKINLIHLFLFITITFSIESCEKNENDSVKKDLLLPLSVGNKWIYNQFTWKITDKYRMTYNNETTDVYSLGIFMDNDSLQPDFKLLYSFDAFGNIYCNGGTLPTDTLNTKTLFLKDSCDKGESWDYYHVVASAESGMNLNVMEIMDTIKMVCFTIDTTIIIPLGSYTCKGFRYSFPDDSDTRTYEYYFSKGVGMVELVTKINGIVRGTTKLQRYQVKN